MYGITETTVHVTWRPLTVADTRTSGSRIGRHLPDLRLHVLDRHLMPVPIGVAGEVHVGGAGLARGYLGRSALTAERFVPDPFSGAGGERLYRSGDLARYLPDGDLEYLGRADHQVKVLGHRIEIGEVEAALESHPGIRQATVVARTERLGRGETRLVAYVVPAGERAPDATVLRQHLRRTLPDSMLCSAFVELPALPLTPSGKIDRAALPEPGRQRPALLQEPAAPSTPLEEELAALWAEVLGVERIGVLDNFLDLGGHSQLAIRIVARVRDRYLVDLPLRVFFEVPTIAELALWILERQLEQSDPAESLRLLERLEAPPPVSPVHLRSSIDGT
jgi:acyl carrier protein